MKIMLIDGNSIINRAFYGIRMLNAPDGTPTNGVYGFITILQRLLDEEKPDGLCAAFDLRAPTFRHLQFEGYKAQRKAMPEELAVQMPLIKEALDAMGIMRIEREGLEADDLLGTLSRRAEREGHECVIVTGDKDSFQLITERTRVLHVKSRMGKTETINYTRERFFEEYGFEPIKMIDLKALMGDASDNIPGVPGVGEKTALDLVRRYGGLGEIYASLSDSGIKDGVRKKLETGRESAKMSYELATIVTNADIDADLGKTAWHNDFRPELYDVFMRLGFTKFIEKYGLKPQEDSDTGRAFEGECTLIQLRSEAEAAAAAESLRGKSVCVWCEGGLDAVTFENDGTAYVLTLDFDGDRTAALGLLFSAPGEMTGHNIKDTMRELLLLGLEPGRWSFDTALAAYLLDATAGSYEVGRLTVKYCGFRPFSAKETEGQLSLLDGGALNDTARLDEYASLAASLACLRPELEARLAGCGMERLYNDVELPLCRVLAQMERDGVYVDRDALHEFGESLSGGIESLESAIWSAAGGRFNINSPKQLGEALFERLMLPAGKKTKTGWSTNADTLERLRGKHPIVQQVLDYRMLTKLKSTYADGLLKVIAPDGRIHTSFQMTVTATGRLSSTEPNLQNIPVRRELGAQIRRMFTAQDGRVLVDADYSQIELRLLAHISGDENMIAAFAQGEDIHSVTASQVFGVPLGEVTPQQRSRAKAVNFGIVYGISAWSLAQDIGVSVNEAKEYMDAYLEKYHGVREYMKSIVEKARADGYVETMFHRRRALPELKSANFATRSFGERVALNMPVQGTAADIIKLAMVNVSRRIEREGLRARLILQVHDELIAECPENEAERVRELLTQEMQSAVQLRVPLAAEAHIGKSWAEAH